MDQPQNKDYEALSNEELHRLLCERVPEMMIFR